MYLQNVNLLETIKQQIRRIEISQIIIAICVILLTIWCAYNVEKIVAKYSERDTIISLENSPPVKTDCPGITICAPSIFKPQKLAELFPDTFGKSFEAYRKWKLQISDDLTDKKDADNKTNRIAEMLYYETLAMKNLTAIEIIQNYSIQFDDLIRSCEFVSINIRKLHILRGGENLQPQTKQCSDMVPVLESIYEQKKCFTFYSLLHNKTESNENEKIWGMNNKKDEDGLLNGTDQEHEAMNRDFKDARDVMVFDLNPSIEIRVKSVENDIWSSYVINPPIVMTVHPPDILQSRRDFLFFQVASSTFNEITFTKKTTILINSKKIKCIYYSEEEEYKDARTRDNCISRCVINKDVSTECANYYGVLSQRMFSKPEYAKKKICPHEKQDYGTYLAKRQACESQCPQECEKTIFEVSGQMRNTLIKNCQRNWKGRQNVVDQTEPHCSGAAMDANATSNDGCASEEVQQYSDVRPIEKAPSEQDDAELHSFMLNIAKTTSFLPLKKINGNRRIYAAPQKRMERSVSDSSFQSDDNGDICEAQVSIRISPKPFTTVRHQEAITQESLIGTIGGHLGIWLGLSLYKIIKFGVQTAYRLLYKIIRDCSKSFDYNMCNR